MALKDRIVLAGTPVLRHPARPVSIEEIRGPELQGLIALMRETMREAVGVGLAAPQVGYPVQLIVVEDRPEYVQSYSPEQFAEWKREPVPFHVLINPKLTTLDEERIDLFESCLSVPGYLGLVPRAASVRVDCLDEDAQNRTIEAKGWYARILQHEIDHLAGTLYVDRIDTRSLVATEHKQWIMQTPITDIRRIFRMRATA